MYVILREGPNQSHNKVDWARTKGEKDKESGCISPFARRSLSKPKPSGPLSDSLQDEVRAMIIILY